jgi:hypothetical protein
MSTYGRVYVRGLIEHWQSQPERGSGDIFDPIRLRHGLTAPQRPHHPSGRSSAMRVVSAMGGAALSKAMLPIPVVSRVIRSGSCSKATCLRCGVLVGETGLLPFAGKRFE